MLLLMPVADRGFAAGTRRGFKSYQLLRDTFGVEAVIAAVAAGAEAGVGTSLGSMEGKF